MTDGQQIISDVLNEYSLSGNIICLHCSYKKISSILPNPELFINLFLKRGCTLIVPAHDYTKQISYSPGIKIIQNGKRDQKIPANQMKVLPYTKRTHLISSEMGVVAKKITERELSHLGNHPENAFAGIGANALKIIRGQTPWDVYAPYDVMMKLDNVKIVLIDVDLTKATPLHYAEMKAGRNMFIRWYKDSGDIVRPMRVGGCSYGFEKCHPFVEKIEKRVHTGTALWRIYPFQDFIETLTRAIEKHPDITHCSENSCQRCTDIIRGGPFFSFQRISNPGLENPAEMLS